MPDYLARSTVRPWFNEVKSQLCDRLPCISTFVFLLWRNATTPFGLTDVNAKNSDWMDKISDEGV